MTKHWKTIEFSAAGLVFVALFGWMYIRSQFSLTIRMHACKQMPCIVSMEELFPGSWDHIYIFDYTADQQEIDHTLGAHLPRPDIERLIVFSQHNHVVRTMSESVDVEKPTKSEVLFERIPQQENHQIIERGWAFVITKGTERCQDCTVVGRIKPGEVVE